MSKEDVLKFKRHHYLFGLIEIERPDGWKDLGFIEKGKGFEGTCDFCYTRLRYGNNKKASFVWCPYCKKIDHFIEHEKED